MIENRQSVNSNTTPEEITTSMIDADLKSGLNKSDMMEKYNIRKWEIDRIFKNPKLTGRRPSPKLSFTFIDDMTDSGHNTVNIDEVLDKPNPNQVTLEAAIDEAIESVETAKNQMHQTQEAIIDMLSPTEFETPAETIAKANDTPEITGIPNGDTMSDTDDEDDTLPLNSGDIAVEQSAIEEEEEEEVVVDEDDFDTFEL